MRDYKLVCARVFGQSQFEHVQIPEDARVLPHDHPRTQAVRFIVDSLKEQIGSLEGLPAHLKDINWNVTVVQHNMVNAMAAPGGQVLVFTGVASSSWLNVASCI